MVGRFLGQSLCLLLLAVSAAQFSGMLRSDDGLRQSAVVPLQAQDRAPASPGDETETNQGKGEFEEMALAQGAAFRVVHLAQTFLPASASCPQTHFTSDWFRPPTLS